MTEADIERALDKDPLAGRHEIIKQEALKAARLMNDRRVVASLSVKDWVTLKHKDIRWGTRARRKPAMGPASCQPASVGSCVHACRLRCTQALEGACRHAHEPALTINTVVTVVLTVRA